MKAFMEGLNVPTLNGTAFFCFRKDAMWFDLFRTRLALPTISIEHRQTPVERVVRT
jgi:hypothetical protein